mmetsp:Transcript_33098/g.53033  ORF Transcript_33098/g.53033 Transcript_33098/m.53033 type:complete len:103 (-) Transcript_33098:300-608(-)
MARGLSREQSLAKNQKKAAGLNKGNQESLTPSQRAERDAAAMKEKKAAKDIEKSALASSGEEGAAQVAADEKRKAEFRLKQKDNKLANHNPQLAKQLRNANK